MLHQINGTDVLAGRGYGPASWTSNRKSTYQKINNFNPTGGNLFKNRA
jgi:hypothetical protein